MKRWRLRVVVPVAVLLLTAAALLAESRIGPVGALLLAALGGIVVGNLLAERLDALRAAVLERARSGGQRLPGYRIAEIHALSSVIEMLVGEFAERTASLARDRDELALLVNNVSEGILQIDAQGRLVRANPAAHALLHLPRDSSGAQASAVIRNTELRHLLARAAGGVTVAAEEIGVDDRRLLVAARPFRDGPSAGAIVAFADLTELRRLEGVRREFVANVSHELKTPLTSIRGYIETLQSDDVPAETQRQFLDVVQRNAERLHHIVEDLLDLSRVESGNWKPELHAIDPLEIARDVWAATIEQQPAARDLTFTAGGDNAPAMADPGALRHVLGNLFDNAVRYTPAGGRIEVRVSQEGAVPGRARFTMIDVRDTGAGIPRDALSRVFERFYRVDPARSRAEGGTGLGLSIVKHLVEGMDGTVSAQSELGKGTTIRIRLPAAAAITLVQQKNAG
ncbi:MAG TPA: ATP-binding protein [Longimicrobiales bacterium]|nr:ATP-binding protein [Longimicrobiales bacterium]